MSSTRESRLRINVDVEQAKRKARELSANLVKMGNTGTTSGQQINTGMVQASQGIRQAGDSAAAAQIRFQTMTQGMLNLSTASIQTFTSISNLARAENRAKASTIAVSRAVDLLANKRERLNDLLKSGIASEQKMINIRREITTATNDLVVKQEKMEIETKAILDIQLLFFASLTNVGVSSYQTISTMISSTTKRMIASTLSTRINSIAQFNNSNALFGNTISRRINVISLSRQAIASHSATIATRLQTLALHGLKIALGPIGLIFIGISAAMVAYETNALGLKDTINGLLGIQDEYADSTKDATGDIDDMANSMADMNAQAFKVPSSLSKARVALKIYREELIKAVHKSREFNAVAPGFKLGGTSSPEAKRLNTGGKFTTAISGGRFGFSALSGLSSLSLLGFLNPPAGSVRIPETPTQTLQRFGGDPFTITELGKSIAGTSLPALKFNTELDKLAARVAFIETFIADPEFRRRQLKVMNPLEQIREQILGITAKPRIPGQDLFDPATGNFLIPGSPFGTPKQQLLVAQLLLSQGVRQAGIENLLDTKAIENKILNGTPLTVKDREKMQIARTLLQQALHGTGGGQFFTPGFQFGTNTGRGLHPAAFGLTGNVLVPKAFNKLFSGGIPVGNTQRGFSASTSRFLQDPSRLQKAGRLKPQGLSLGGGDNFADTLALLGIGGGDIDVGVDQFAKSNFSNPKQRQAFLDSFEASGSVSQALSDSHQFSQAQNFALQQRSVVRAIEDRNRNLLRNGGTRVLDPSGVPLPLSDQNAVKGGFATNRQAQREFRRLRVIQVNQDQAFLRLIGVRVGGSPRLRGANIMRTARPLRELFLRTGVSISAAGLLLARRKGAVGTELLGIDPRFIDAMTASFSFEDLQNRARAENRFINDTDIALEENRQEIIKIRFDANRGDRELLNRLRFVERLEAASSGTSPL